uniref:L1 transposable element RRM domain-containing protein n=1 Tax=Acanthochromis polyacanthus TaxID=80966 RepID=A0A3Q1FZE5_9TELE
RPHTPLHYNPGPKRSGDCHIIVRFLKFKAWEEVLQAAREKGRVERQGKQISFFQDLSQDVIQRRKKFDGVKKRLREKNTHQDFLLRYVI